jgi:hypothetical protein
MQIYEDFSKFPMIGNLNIFFEIHDNVTAHNKEDFVGHAVPTMKSDVVRNR